MPAGHASSVNRSLAVSITSTDGRREPGWDFGPAQGREVRTLRRSSGNHKRDYGFPCATDFPFYSLQLVLR